MAETMGQRDAVSTDFRKELEVLINRHSKENGSNTPDFILANYLMNCLNAFDMGIRQRDQWHGYGKQGQMKSERG